MINQPTDGSGTQFGKRCIMVIIYHQRFKEVYIGRMIINPIFQWDFDKYYSMRNLYFSRCFPCILAADSRTIQIHSQWMPDIGIYNFQNRPRNVGTVICNFTFILFFFTMQQLQESLVWNGTVVCVCTSEFNRYIDRV